MIHSARPGETCAYRINGETVELANSYTEDGYDALYRYLNRRVKDEHGQTAYTSWLYATGTAGDDANPWTFPAYVPDPDGSVLTRGDVRAREVGRYVVTPLGVVATA